MKTFKKPYSLKLVFWLQIKNKKAIFLLPSCITKHNNRDSDYITKNKKKEKLKDGLQNDNFPQVL